MENWKLYLAAYFLIVNLISFMTVGFDKKKAIEGHWRIPENRFLILGLTGGAVGVYLGMKGFRHKTQHISFIYGMPLLIAINFFVFWYIFRI